jgi:hypothetical protein
MWEASNARAPGQVTTGVTGSGIHPGVPLRQFQGVLPGVPTIRHDGAGQDAARH